MIHTFSVGTNRRTEMVDITGQVQELVRLSGVKEGRLSNLLRVI